MDELEDLEGVRELIPSICRHAAKQRWFRGRWQVEAGEAGVVAAAVPIRHSVLGASGLHGSTYTHLRRSPAASGAQGVLLAFPDQSFGRLLLPHYLGWRCA